MYLLREDWICSSSYNLQLVCVKNQGRKVSMYVQTQVPDDRLVLFIWLALATLEALKLLYLKAYASRIVFVSFQAETRCISRLVSN